MGRFIRSDQVAGKSIDPVMTHVSVESLLRQYPNASGPAAKIDEVTGHLMHKGSGTGRNSEETAERLDLVHM